MSYQNLNAYGNSQPQAPLDGREIDKRALLNCASRLKEAMDDGGKNMQMYREAIRHNQHLWTLFQVSLTDPSNPLRRELKLNLLRLSGYVDKVSFRAIGSFMPDRLESLININRIIAAGLAKVPQNAAPVIDPAQANLAPEGAKAVAFNISA